MADLYVNATSGRDAADRGEALSNPLRTVTFAVAEAVRRFGSSFTMIHAAGGLHNRALGEEFPLLLPQNVSLFGAGVDRTIIDYERSPIDMFDHCLRGGREVANLTIQGYPETEGACDFSSAISLVADGSYVHDLFIRANSAVALGEGVFAHGIQAIDLHAIIERVDIRRCGEGIVCSGNARVRHCLFDENGAGISLWTGDPEISDCTFESKNTYGISAFTPSNGSIVNNRFNACIAAAISVSRSPSLDALSDTIPWIGGNNIRVEGAYGILCDSEARIENNQIEVVQARGAAMRVGRVDRFATLYAAHPEIRGNVFRMMAILDSSLVIQPLLSISEACDPLVEGNEFSVEGPFFITVLDIQHDANPDLGGGAKGSLGQNRFAGGWIAILADELSIAREIYARDNFWRYAPPRRGPDMYVPGDYYITPREAVVSVHVEGAMQI